MLLVKVRTSLPALVCRQRPCAHPCSVYAAAEPPLRSFPNTLDTTQQPNTVSTTEGVRRELSMTTTTAKTAGKVAKHSTHVVFQAIAELPPFQTRVPEWPIHQIRSVSRALLVP